MTNSLDARRLHRRSRLTLALALWLATTALGTSLPGAGALAAQPPAQNPCGLLTSEEVQALVESKEEHASNGIAEAFTAQESFTCRYTWGSGTGRYTLAVSVNPASRAYVGM